MTMENIKNIFRVEEFGKRPHNDNDDVMIALTFEMNLDMIVIDRQVYSSLDWMGDIGGLSGALYSTFAAAIIIFQYKAVISYVSNHTFLIRDGDERDSVSKVQ